MKAKKLIDVAGCLFQMLVTNLGDAHGRSGNRYGVDLVFAASLRNSGDPADCGTRTSIRSWVALKDAVVIETPSTP